MRGITPLISLRRLCRRHHRTLGVGVLVALTLLVSVERRLADIQYNFRSTASGFLNVASLDGDEIRVRLIALNDDRSPALPSAALRVVSFVALCARGGPRFDPATWTEPRAPPDRHLSVVA